MSQHSTKNNKEPASVGHTIRPYLITGFILAIFVAGVLIMNLRSPITYSLYDTDTISYEKGIVTSIQSEQLEDSVDLPGLKLGLQEITVKLKNGVLKGQEILISNILTNTHSIYVKKGQHVIVKADRPDGIEPYCTLYNYDRSNGLVVVLIIFIGFMLLVGRTKGLRSVLGLFISLFFIIAFLLPAIYHGYSPLVTTILTGITITSFSLLLLNGFSRKTFVALSATAGGILLSGLFFVIISAALSLSGFNIEEAEELILVSRSTGLKTGQVLFSGVMLSSLGAVMDMTISVSSSLYELKEQQPRLTVSALFNSGMVIGRDMIGSMCQTLILAFVGSSIAALLTMVSYGTKLDQLLSSDYIAIEVVHGITGSLAVITAVPITAGLVSLYFAAKQTTQTENKAG